MGVRTKGPSDFKIVKGSNESGKWSLGITKGESAFHTHKSTLLKMENVLREGETDRQTWDAGAKRAENHKRVMIKSICLRIHIYKATRDAKLCSNHCHFS